MPRFVANERFAATADFRLSDATAETQTGPVLAALPSGGFIAAWEDQTFGAYLVKAQIFDRNGREVGAEFVVDQGPESHEPSVATFPAGGFVITWSKESAYPASFDVKAQLFDAGGARVGSELLVNTTTAGFQVQSMATGLVGGGFVVTWLQPNDGTFDNVRGQVFAADGTKIGGEFIAADGLPGTKEQPDVVGLAAGGFVIAWSQAGAETTGDGNLSSGSRAQLFDASGNKVGSAFPLNTIVPGVQQNPDLAALPGGGFVAAWTDDGNPFMPDPHPENLGIWMQIFDAAGAKVGAAVHVSTQGPFGGDTPDVEIIPGTGFIITWKDSNITGEDSAGHLRAQVFDFAGNKTGEEFSINPGLNAAQNLPDLTVLTTGAFVVGWTNWAAPQFNNEDVRARMFFPTILGTEGDDSFVGTANRDFYLAKGDDDEIFGGAEDDGLDGGGGNDLLDGGAGNDDLAGGTGNDVYILDSAGDLVVEAAAGGSDMIITSASYTLGAGQEIETLRTAGSATSFAVNFTGNEFTNALAGNAAANVLDGKGGADVMWGYAGNDTYYVDNGADQVGGETAGGGSDLVVTNVSFTLRAGQEVEQLRTYGSLTTAAINLTGNEFVNTIVGNAAANDLNGKGGADAMYGFAGNDTYYVDNGADSVTEAVGGGADTIIANVSYTLGAGEEVELLRTYGSATTNAVDLTGNEIANTFVGNAAANQLDGKGGADTFYGYGGADTFAFTSALGGGNVDGIADFDPAADIVALDDAVFTGLAAGALNPNAFVVGSAAADASDRIIYNSATGQLSFDADGVGGAAAVQFASLSTGLAITAGDFTVI